MGGRSELKGEKKINESANEEELTQDIHERRTNGNGEGRRSGRTLSGEPLGDS